MAFNAFKLKRARKILEDAGIEVGVSARITWRFDGGGIGAGVESEHTGPVSFYDGEWIELKPTTRSPGHLRLPIVALVSGHTVEVVEEVEPEPVNPFIKKARERAES